MFYSIATHPFVCHSLKSHSAVSNLLLCVAFGCLASGGLVLLLLLLAAFLPGLPLCLPGPPSQQLLGSLASETPLLTDTGKLEPEQISKHTCSSLVWLPPILLTAELLPLSDSESLSEI
ncbi:unnamed protein product [Protopolystoma xenopodis]|uniref:Uncharacterized protein n=1 Tax=Protopolystoma xenopodis TaxID=117903 RepID=A0A448WLV0_9PLAT|nr:unnamed protein product [Protopolystoma xenopodis]